MKNNKKKLISYLFIVGIIIMLIGITYSFFNFTDSSEELIFSNGEVYMKLRRDSNNGNNISFNGVFPEKYDDAVLKNDNYIDFSIIGKNSYDKPVYYEIKLRHGDVPNNKTEENRINDNLLCFELIDLTNNKTILSDYSFDSLDNIRVYVDTFNQGDDLTRTYRLRMWYSEHILISDTDPQANFRATIDNPDENPINHNKPVYNNVFASVYVEVYGDFIEKVSPSYPLPLYKMIKAQATVSSGDQYQSGIFIDNNTINNPYPINYYSGYDVPNNLVFGDYCWKIVRTTETGGIKLLYNGTVTKHMENYTDINQSDYNVTSNTGLTYNNSNKMFETGDTLPMTNTSRVIFNVTSEGYYKLEYEIEAINYANFELQVNNNNIVSSSTDSSRIKNGSVEIGFLSTSDVVNINLDSFFRFDFYTVDENNLGHLSFKLKKGTDPNVEYFCQANVSYIYEETYDFGEKTIGDIYKTISVTNNAYLVGTNYTYSNGTYTLTDPVLINSSNYNQLRDHRYLIKSSTNSSDKVYFINNRGIYSSTVQAHVIELTNGEDIKTKLENTIRNFSFPYTTILNNFYDSLNVDYNDIEDTVFCRDRSIDASTITGEGEIKLNALSRLESGNYSYNCPKEDSYTVSSDIGNGLLTKPIGLLSSDEYKTSGSSLNLKQAEASMSFSTIGKINYREDLTPYVYRYFGGSMFSANYGADINASTYFKYLRPSISLRPGIKYLKGDGSRTNPYYVQ